MLLNQPQSKVGQTCAYAIPSIFLSPGLFIGFVRSFLCRSPKRMYQVHSLFLAKAFLGLRAYLFYHDEPVKISMSWHVCAHDEYFYFLGPNNSFHVGAFMKGLYNDMLYLE